MGHWGIKSYENDDAHDALDAGFDRACGPRYEDLMDDRDPLTLEQVQQQLASPETLEAALAWLREEFGDEPTHWDDEARLALAGVVVRHAELKIPLPEPLRQSALDALRSESLEWDEETKRRLRRDKEIQLLEKLAP